MRISVDTIDKQSLWLDEFEVIIEYRKKGNGIKVISELIADSPSNIKLLAKNKQVQQFWVKCDFEDDSTTWAEIQMIYRKVY